MKILLSHCWYPAKEPVVEHFARAFEILGHETVIHYDNKDKDVFLLMYRIFLRTPFYFLAFKCIEWYRNKMSREFIRKVDEVKPDFVFVIQGSHQSSLLPEKIRKRGIPIALWVLDDPMTRHEFDPYFIKSHFGYDHLFVADEYWMPSLRLLGDVHYLPFATDHETFKPLGTKKDLDIVFVGGFGSGPNISKSIILSALKDFNLTIAGPGIKSYAHTVLGKPTIIDRFIEPAFINELYNRAKIVLSLHHVQFKGDPCPRTFDAAISKSFQISEFRKNTGELFGGTVVEFISPSDLRDKVAYYLAHDAEREKYLETCYDIALARHTYVERAREVLRVVFH